MSDGTDGLLLALVARVLIAAPVERNPANITIYRICIVRTGTFYSKAVGLARIKLQRFLQSGYRTLLPSVSVQDGWSG